MIRLNVFIRTTGENRAELLSTARRLVEASQREEGCVAYDIFESATREEVLLICETWRDEAALDAHKLTAHYTSLAPRLGELGEVKLEKFIF